MKEINSGKFLTLFSSKSNRTLLGALLLFPSIVQCQDVNAISVSIELGGDFPIGKFTGLEYPVPLAASVSTGTIYELTAGYKISDKSRIKAMVFDDGFEPDPSALGVQELIQEYPGVYDGVQILKNGKLTILGIMAGIDYRIPLSAASKWFFTPQVMAGMGGCGLPEIEIIGNHPVSPANSQGFTMDTAETWDTPSLYSWSFIYLAGLGCIYQLNSRFECFGNADYRGALLQFGNSNITYTEQISETYTGNNTTAIIASNSIRTLFKPSFQYQSISVCLGFTLLF